MELSRDFNDLLRALSNAGAEYLIVGAHALGIHDRPRTTKDLDVWIRATPENAHRTWQALAAFGAPMDRLRVEDLIDEDTIFEIGVAPLRIDILTSISGVTFDKAWPNRIEVERDGLRVPFIGVEDFLANKDASGRDQDIVDAANVRRRLGRTTS
jgi:predicted nucleotidyltransferase